MLLEISFLKLSSKVKGMTWNFLLINLPWYLLSINSIFDAWKGKISKVQKNIFWSWSLFLPSFLETLISSHPPGGALGQNIYPCCVYVCVAVCGVCVYLSVCLYICEWGCVCVCLSEWVTHRVQEGVISKTTIFYTLLHLYILYNYAVLKMPLRRALWGCFV